MDLPVWQSLYEELKDDGFTVLAVAMDSRGAEAARPWIEQANPGYDCLVDQEHHVAELYNMVNVPQAVWIDEEGWIVRPTEVAGSSDGFRAMDRNDFSIPDAEAEKIAQGRAVYLDALRDWVAKGEASEFVSQGDDVRARQAQPDETIALANANFRLGQHLQRHGNAAEGIGFLREASRLRPESWNFWRQTADLEEVGKSGGPEFWARVDALGDDHYYAPVDMPGMPR
jgi:hypothetical protein